MTISEVFPPIYGCASPHLGSAAKFRRSWPRTASTSRSTAVQIATLRTAVSCHTAAQRLTVLCPIYWTTSDCLYSLISRPHPYQLHDDTNSWIQTGDSKVIDSPIQSLIVQLQEMLSENPPAYSDDNFSSGSSRISQPRSRGDAGDLHAPEKSLKPFTIYDQVQIFDSKNEIKGTSFLNNGSDIF